MKPDFWAIVGVGVVLLGVILTGQVKVEAQIATLHDEFGVLRSEMNNQRRELSAQIQHVRDSVSGLQNSFFELRSSVSGLSLSVANLENRVSLIEDILEDRLPNEAASESGAAQG